MKLPQDVERYLSEKLPLVPWDTLAEISGDLCRECPQHSQQDPNDENPVCLSCPWFGYLYGALQAQHWHPRHRRGRRSK